MTVKQMADMITFIQAYGDEQGVKWSDETLTYEAKYDR
jgi:hypothetical protein